MYRPRTPTEKTTIGGYHPVKTQSTLDQEYLDTTPEVLRSLREEIEERLAEHMNLKTAYHEALNFIANYDQKAQAIDELVVAFDRACNALGSVHRGTNSKTIFYRVVAERMNNR